jgi:hypothetical protein
LRPLQDLYSSTNTLVHGSLSQCIVRTDLERNLVVVQIRKTGGPRHPQWAHRFFAAIADSVVEQGHLSGETGGDDFPRIPRIPRWPGQTMPNSRGQADRSTTAPPCRAEPPAEAEARTAPIAVVGRPTISV